jgi:hypothetical protein
MQLQGVQKPSLTNYRVTSNPEAIPKLALMRAGSLMFPRHPRAFNHWMASSAVSLLEVGAIVLFFHTRRMLRVASPS